ncbi:hypothetical protein SRHO_G00116220 [Serrasalmus rhombeus]
MESVTAALTAAYLRGRKRHSACSSKPERPIGAGAAAGAQRRGPGRVISELVMKAGGAENSVLGLCEEKRAVPPSTPSARAPLLLNLWLSVCEGGTAGPHGPVLT